MYYPRIRPEVMDRVEAELLGYLLRNFTCQTCTECIFCWRDILQHKITTQKEKEAMLEKLLIPVKTNETMIEFFEVRCDNHSEYYNSLTKAQERARELEEAMITATIIGREFD